VTHDRSPHKNEGMFREADEPGLSAAVEVIGRTTLPSYRLRPPRKGQRTA
jgi:hypothetical protein